MRIILSEGSGLTSRQTAGRLGELGHEVELLSSSKLCLSRFTRHVRAVHPVPNFGSDPFGWVSAAMEVARTRDPANDDVNRRRTKLPASGPRNAQRWQLPSNDALRDTQRLR